MQAIILTTAISALWSVSGYFAARHWFRRSSEVIEGYYGRDPAGNGGDGVMAAWTSWMGPAAWVFGWYLHSTSPHVHVAKVFGRAK